MANLQSTNVVGTLCVNGVAIGGGKDLKYCCFTGSTTWTPPSDLVTGDGVVDALLVGGGGGAGGVWKGFPGGTRCCLISEGGGGGGGIVQSLLTMTSSNDACTITIGAGGQGGLPDDNNSGAGRECGGCAGGNTVFGNSGSGSDSAIAFGGAGSERRHAGCASGSCFLYGGGGGCRNKETFGASANVGGSGAASLNPITLWNTNGTLEGLPSMRAFCQNFIQGYVGGNGSSNSNSYITSGKGLMGYGQAYYVSEDPFGSETETCYFAISGSVGWGSGGSGGVACTATENNMAALGGGSAGYHNNGQPAPGCGGGGGGASSPKFVGCAQKLCGGDGAPGIMVIKWQQ